MSRSVIGFDIGNSVSTVAITRKGGVDVLANEASHRQTASLVAFSSERRFMGEAAATQHGRNLANTVEYLPRLLALSTDDPAGIAREQAFCSFKIVPDPRSTTRGVGAQVQFKGQTLMLGARELVSMLLHALQRVVTLDASGRRCDDVVLSVPAFMPEAGRRALLDAAQVVGLAPLRLLHPTTAAALAYGFYKPWDEAVSRVLFVDVGACATQASIVEFSKKGMKVLATEWDEHLGGRDWDSILVTHFTKAFEAKHKGVELRKSARAMFRLRQAVERTRKVLTVNSSAPLHVESLYEEQDFSSVLSRTDFEELVRPEFSARLAVVLDRLFAATQLTVADIASTELVGAATRTPFISEVLSAYTKKEVLRTTNSEEVVVKGCAIMAAILSPTFRTREWEVVECAPYAVDLEWKEEGAEGVNSAIGVMARNGGVPINKMVTFAKARKFELSAYKSLPTTQNAVDPSITNNGNNTRALLVKAVVDQIPALSDEKTKVKVRVSMTADALMSVDYVQAHEEYEEAIPDTNNTTKPVKKTRKTPIPFTLVYTSISPPALISALIAEETARIQADESLLALERARNSLEAYVYHIREHISSTWAKFISASDAKTLLSLCDVINDWLYNEGESCESIAEYTSRLDSLYKIAEPVKKRYADKEDRPHVMKQYDSSIQAAREAIASTDENVAHITPEERNRIGDKLKEWKDWMEKVEKCRTAGGVDNPEVWASEVEERVAILNKLVKDVMSKPKPKKEEKKTEEKKEEKKEGEEKKEEVNKEEDVEMKE